MTLADFIVACDALRADAEREVAAAGTLEAWMSWDTILGGAGFRSQSVAGAERELTAIPTM